MNSKKTKKITHSAMLAAICCVATLVVRIPTQPGGYINLGDAAMLISGYLLGPVYGGFSAALGSAFADIAGEFAYYAPGTFIIKWLCCATASIIYTQGKKSAAALVISSVFGEIIMIAGYFFYSAVILSKGIAAAAEIYSNLLQAFAAVIISFVIMRTFPVNKKF